MVQDTIDSNAAATKLPRRRWVLLAIAILLIFGSGTAYLRWWFQSPSSDAPQTAVTSIPKIKTVTALGRLEPKGEVIQLAAPASSQGSRVEQLLVEQGDRVKAGQVIAILDSHDRLQAAVGEAEEEVRVAQAKLSVTKAGAKQGEIAAQRAAIFRLEAQRQGDIAAQEATVARLQAEVQNAEVEYQRHEALYQTGAISASERDRKRLALETTLAKEQGCTILLVTHDNRILDIADRIVHMEDGRLVNSSINTEKEAD